MYIDDKLLPRPNENHIAEFKVELNATFEIFELVLWHHYLGIHFLQCKDGGIDLLQTKYIETLLHRFKLEDCKFVAVPMETSLHLNIHDLRDYIVVVLYQ